MVKSPLPTLSTTGWIDDPQQVAIKLMAYYLTAVPAQTNYYSGHSVTLTQIVQRYGNDEQQFRATIIEKLTALYSAYFQGVNVRAEIEPILDKKLKETDGFNIKLTITYMNNNIENNLFFQVTGNNNQFEIVKQLVNGVLADE